jgi:hypothetical protein
VRTQLADGHREPTEKKNSARNNHLFNQLSASSLSIKHWHASLPIEKCKECAGSRRIDEVLAFAELQIDQYAGRHRYSATMNADTIKRGME